VVIDNLDVDRAGRAFGPLKADPPLVIDTDAVFALPIALQIFQPVAGSALDYGSRIVGEAVVRSTTRAQASS
jgi:hypothetical protein